MEMSLGDGKDWPESPFDPVMPLSLIVVNEQVEEANSKLLFSSFCKVICDGSSSNDTEWSEVT